MPRSHSPDRSSRYHYRLHALDHSDSESDDIYPLPASQRRAPSPPARPNYPHSYTYTEGLSSLRPPPAGSVYPRSQSYTSHNRGGPYADEPISPLTRPGGHHPPSHPIPHPHPHPRPQSTRPDFTQRRSSSHTTLSSHSSAASASARRPSPHRHQHSRYSHEHEHDEHEIEDWELEREMVAERKIMDERRRRSEEAKHVQHGRFGKHGSGGHGKHKRGDDFDKLEVVLGLGTFGLALAAMAAGSSAPQIK